MENNEKIVDFCFENSLRLEKIIHIGSMCYEHDAFNNDAYELFEYEDKIWEALELEKPEDYQKDVIAEHLVDNKKFGFLIKANTPVPTFHSKDSASFSWGRYTEKLFYADTFEDAFDKAKNWCIEYYDKQKNKQIKQCA